MKRIFFLLQLFLLVSCATISQTNTAKNIGLTTYTKFLKNQKTSGKDYVFKLFKQYDIVILCERDHAEVTQYDLILDILKDKRFSKQIGNIYCELGNPAYDEQLNEFLQNPKLNEKEVSDQITTMQRNIFPFIWEKATYPYLLKGIYNINKNLQEKRKINLYSLDYSVKWETVKQSDIDAFIPINNSRDSLMADKFKNYYVNSNSKKALVIMNSRHAFLNDFVRKNFGYYTSKNFKGKVANVFLNTISFTSSKITDRNVPESAISSPQDGKWEASFIKSRKDNIGFNFKNSPFGKDSFDLLPVKNQYTYADMFNGFIYYKPLPEWKRISGIGNLVDKDFESEALRRLQLEQNFEKAIYKNKTEPEEDLMSIIKNRNVINTETYREFLPEVVKNIEELVEKSSNR